MCFFKKVLFMSLYTLLGALEIGAVDEVPRKVLKEQLGKDSFD